MRPAADLDAFRLSPDGTYLVGPRFLYLCESPELYAFFLWGRPTGDEMRHIVDVLAVEMRPDAKPHKALVDVSGLTGIDGEAFGVLRDFLESIKHRQKEITQREAVVRPGGLPGTIIAGFYLVFPQPFPTRVFTEVPPALEWLDLDPAYWRAWSQLVASVRGTSPELAQLRAVLEKDLGGIDLASAARTLSTSTRTLQRKLKDLGTSFHTELDRARLDEAERLIAETDEKLTAIAARVGFASYPHFSQWYRRSTGVTAESRRRAAQQPA